MSQRFSIFSIAHNVVGRHEGWSEATYIPAGMRAPRPNG